MERYAQAWNELNLCRMREKFETRIKGGGSEKNKNPQLCMDSSKKLVLYVKFNEESNGV